MTTKVGYFDLNVGRCLTSSDVAAIATIKFCFYIEESETANRDCLALWDIIQEWSNEGKEFAYFNDFIQTVRQQRGFNFSYLCNACIFKMNMYFADYIEYMDDLHCNYLSIL